MGKKELRKEALSRRRALTEEQRREYSDAICRKIFELPELCGVKTVFSYLAAWDEADMSLLNAELEKRGLRVAYPVCFDGGIMEAYIPETEDAVESAAFGIKSPIVSRSVLVTPEEIDLVIVPCVGFDGEKNRLGHGGGYYDRYLARCPQAKTVCTAFEAQRLDAIPTDEYDIKPNIVVTETTLIR